ncbi:hypothetical protein Tco_0700377 [Tanacetum coccineum]
MKGLKLAWCRGDLWSEIWEAASSISSLYRHHCVMMISILVTPRVSALAGCDRLVSEPLVIEKRFVFLLFFEFYFDLRATRYQKIQKRSHLRRSFRGTKGGRVVEESEKEVDSDLLSDACSRSGPAELGDYCESKVKPKRGPA